MFFEACSFLLTVWLPVKQFKSSCIKFIYNLKEAPIVDQELEKWLDNPPLFCDLALHLS